MTPPPAPHDAAADAINMDYAAVKSQPWLDLRDVHIPTWIALTEPGWPIVVSLDRLGEGHDIADVVMHEGVHELLLTATPFGRMLMQLAAFAADPPAQGIDAARTRRLAAIGMQACFVTQEACATATPLLHLPDHQDSPYWRRLPLEYREAAEHLLWLRDSDLPGSTKFGLLVSIGACAMSPPVFEEWADRGLWEVRRWREWLRDPGRGPDERFLAICRALSGLPAHEIERLAADPGSTEEIGRAASLDVSTLTLPPDWRQWSEGLATFVGLKLSVHSEEDDPTPEELDAWAARGTAAPAEPSPMRLVLAAATAPAVLALESPDLAELVRYPLVRLSINHTGNAVDHPWSEDGARESIQPGGAIFQASTPSGAAVEGLMTRELVQQYLTATSDDTTLVVPLPTYDLARGDFREAAGASVAGRSHIVAASYVTPDRMMDELATHGLAGDRAITWVLTESRRGDAAYLLVRPSSRPYPIVVCPTLRKVLPLVLGVLTDESHGVSTYQARNWRRFFADGRAGLAHATRWVSTFDGDPWHWRYYRGGTRTLPVRLPIRADEVASIGGQLEKQGEDAAAAALYAEAIEKGQREHARIGAIQQGLLDLRLHLHERSFRFFTADWLRGDEFLASLGGLWAARAAELGLRYDLAIPQYEEVTKSFANEHAVAAEVGLGDCFAALGDYERAFEAYDKVIVSDYDLHSSTATVQKGKALILSGRQKEAEVMMTSLIERLSAPELIARVTALARDGRVADTWWREHLETAFGKQEASAVLRLSHAFPLRRS